MSVYGQRGLEQPRLADPTFWLSGEPGWGRQADNRAAVVCRRGHVKESSLTAMPASSGHCTECAAANLSRCPSCQFRILGSAWHPGIAIVDRYEPPKFCDNCGEPFLWANRRQRIYQLENLLDGEDVDDMTRLLVQEDLERLRAPDGVPEPEQLEIWKRSKDRAPRLLADTGWKISQSLLTTYVKDKLKLH